MKKGATLMEAVMPAHASVAEALQTNRTPHLAAQLRRLYERVAEFQRRVFPDQAFESKAKHLIREVTEWMDTPDDHMEAADCFILLLGCADKQGMTLEQLVTAAHTKMDENNLRRWAPAGADGVHHHLEDAR